VRHAIFLLAVGLKGKERGSMKNWNQQSAPLSSLEGKSFRTEDSADSGGVFSNYTVLKRQKQAPAKNEGLDHIRRSESESVGKSEKGNRRISPERQQLLWASRLAG